MFTVSLTKAANCAAKSHFTGLRKDQVSLLSLTNWLVLASEKPLCEDLILNLKRKITDSTQRSPFMLMPILTKYSSFSFEVPN